MRVAMAIFNTFRLLDENANIIGEYTLSVELY